MAMVEDIIFSDPVLQRIFFDKRRFAPRSEQAAGKISHLHQTISEMQVVFLKAKTMPTAEMEQYEMRACWFAIRKLCDGYCMTMPAGFDDGCEHVEMFAHENADKCFQVDFKARKALWLRYGRRPPPPWQRVLRRKRRFHRVL